MVIIFPVEIVDGLQGGEELRVGELLGGRCGGRRNETSLEIVSAAVYTTHQLSPFGCFQSVEGDINSIFFKKSLSGILVPSTKGFMISCDFPFETF